MTISTPVNIIITAAAIVPASVAVAAAASPIAATGVVGQTISTTSNIGNQAPGRPQALSSSDENLTPLDSNQLPSSPASEEGPHSPSASGVSPPRSAYSSHSSSPWSPPLSNGYYHSGTSESNYPVDARIGHIDCTLTFDECKYKLGSRRSKK
ncbi:MAG: hypothetical protein J3R72DRAFT_497203 [Linnemannia gamsii]|nr:MAG: hypothetical protein J3R72DRAFT_497203 [Linnemannia gamsii]